MWTEHEGVSLDNYQQRSASSQRHHLQFHNQKEWKKGVKDLSEVEVNQYNYRHCNKASTFPRGFIRTKYGRAPDKQILIRQRTRTESLTPPNVTTNKDPKKIKFSEEKTPKLEPTKGKQEQNGIFQIENEGPGSKWICTTSGGSFLMALRSDMRRSWADDAMAASEVPQNKPSIWSVSPSQLGKEEEKRRGNK